MLRKEFSAGRPLPTLAKWVLVLSAVGVATFAVWILGNHYDPTLQPLLGSLAKTTLGMFGFLFGLCVVFDRKFDPRLRRGWLFLSLAIFFNMLGEALWMYYESYLGIDPFPSLADVFYLLYYPLMLGGLLLFPFAPARPLERRTLGLDLAIVMTFCAMFAWYFILAPLSQNAQPGWAGIIALAYPVGDLLLLAGVVALIQRDVLNVARGALFFLACSLICTTSADSLFLYFELNGQPYSTAILNIFWLASALLDMAAISWQILSAQSGPTKAALRFDRSRHLLRLALPYLAIALDTILVVIAVNRNELIDWRTPGLLNGLLFLTSLVLLRQFMVLRANTNLYEEMKRLASTDSLTELYNRHFFNEVFPLEIERARRYDKPLAILLMDIDGFKAINDHLGHLRGDEVLKVVARSLANQLRAADLIARFGGDEFIVILPETSKEEASVVTDRLKQAVARQKVGEFPLGITIGAASFHPDISPKALLEEADRDLYRQKLLPSTQTP